MNQHVNEVRLVGRLGSNVDARELPSGTVLTNFSIIIDRPAREVRGRTKVDTISCQTTRATVAGRLQRLEHGQVIEISGVLRRRFWKAGGGLASATEVDVRQLVLVKEAS